MTHLPLDRWAPLSVEEITQLFAGAPFVWGLAGGYAIEQFVGRALRDHGDVDVLVFRDNQQLLQVWLNPGWRMYAANPPGSLRIWDSGEHLTRGVNDVWAHQKGSQSWQMQIMFMEVAEDRWFSRRAESVGGDRSDLIVQYRGVPCIRVEVQLLFKSKACRPKDTLDLHSCLPAMTEGARSWLLEKLQVLYPEGHPWQDIIAQR